VNIIPVIDISLVLLVILFVTAPLLAYPTLPVSLPKARIPPNQDVTVAITLFADGRLALRANEERWEDLDRDLRVELARRKDSIVLIRADESVPYRQIQKLIALAKKAGAPQVALATDPPK
jgi:biopolymer transport protein ExbD